MPVKRQRISNKAEKTPARKKKAKLINAAVPLTPDTDDDRFNGWGLKKVATEVTWFPPIKNPPTQGGHLRNSCVYHSINNVAFAKLRRGFIYKCILDGCRFQSLVKETLMNHLNAKHFDQTWSGYCNICEQSVAGSESRLELLDEFEHLEAHIELFTMEDRDRYWGEANVTNKADNNLTAPIFDLKALQIQAETSSNLVESITPKSSQPAFLKRFKLPPSLSVSAISPSSSSSSSLNLTPPEKPSWTVSKRKISKSPSVESNKSFVLSKETQKNSQLLRPWINSVKLNRKSFELAVAMQTKHSLCSMYKCMSSTCSFFTSKAFVFAQHLSLHVKFTATDKDNFLMCSYCEFSGLSAEHLIKHIDHVHIHDRFQCNYCFYRSSTDFNVLTHQLLFHLKDENRILECQELKPRDLISEYEEAKVSRDKNVPPMICVFCQGIFFAMQTFERHLKSHKGHLKARCNECGQDVTNATMLKHFENCLNFGMFQCVFCVFGTNNIHALKNHVANVHPSKIPLFCVRVEAKNDDGTLKHVSKL